MSKGRTVRRGLVALCAALALVAFCPASAHRAAGERGDADLSSEARTLDSFGDALFKFDLKCAELDKKAALSRTEFERVKSEAADLNGRVGQVQQALRSIVEKLKRAGQWDDFNEAVLQKIRDGRTRHFLNGEGGAKRVLEAAVAQAGGLTGEVNTWRERLKVKVREEGAALEEQDSGWRLARAIYIEPSPALLSGKCFFAKVRRFVSSLANGGCPTSEAATATCHACGDSLTQCPECDLN